MRPALALAFLAAMLAAPPAGHGADSPDQRLACHDEARRRIKGPLRVDVDLYRRVVDRRHLYVQDCMTNGLRDIDHTGSIRVPLPPKRPAAPDE